MTGPDEAVGDAVPLKPAPRWVAPLFAALGAITVPWTVYLAISLPEHARTTHYRLTWVGFDVLLIVVLLGTAYLAARGRRLVGLLAAAAATMLVVDAWFDVTTSPHTEVRMAVATAVLVELPLAVVCCWIALHVDQVVDRRLRRLARRAALAQAGKPARGRRGAAPVAEQLRSGRH